MVKTRHSAKSAPSTQPPAHLPAMSPAPHSKFPPQARFPLLVILSMGLSSFLYSTASPFTSGDLAAVSHTRDEWWEVCALLGWKAAQLAVGWYGNYDSYDIASLTLLSHAPFHYFLLSFYVIRPSTILTYLAIDIVSASLPFYLFKPTSSVHSLTTPRGVAANRSVINDFQTQATTSLLAACIYGLVLLGSYTTWLPTYIVTHFDGVRDISRLHESNFPLLALSFVPLGVAARVFVFTPATAAKPDRWDAEVKRFDPEAASLWETVVFNLWGYSKRTRVLVKRTVTLVAVSTLHTSLQTFVTVEGSEGLGGVGWSSVWGLAATLTGVAFWWVGDVEGMDN